MKKSALICLILTCLFVTALCWGNTYVKKYLTWSEARDYCMKNHKGLTSISNEQEDEDLRQYNATAWIGLHKHRNDKWKWAGGENATFFRWAPGNPLYFNETCVAHNRDGWHNNSCEQQTTHNFFCFDSSLVLVKEKKTWEEAMEHCRDQSRDLVSLPSKSAVDETLEAIIRAQGVQTDRVWTGLRYLGDRWLWVSAHPVSYLVPPSHVKTTDCPTWIHRCGALSVKGGTVDGWDCADKLNFVCDNTLS